MSFDGKTWLVGMSAAVALTVMTGALSRAAAPPRAGAPRGTLTVAQGIDADTLDPQVTSSSAVWSVTLNIYDTLITRDGQGKLVPGLAASWKSLNDSTWQIKLREGVKFHDGEPLDANAVKFSIARALDPSVKSVFASSLDTIARIEVVDPLTVNIVTKAPDPILPSRLCMQQGQILPPKYASDVGAEGLGKRPVGAGPYKFVSWRRDEAITLEAVADHWRRPKIAKVVFKPLPEGASRVAAVRTGAVDIAAAIPPVDFAGIQKGERTTGIAVTSNRAFLLNLDTLTFKPFTDRRVRQALNYAVDKDAIVKNTLNGYGRVLATSVIPEAFGYDPNIHPYPYDPARAKKLLAEAGYANGFDVGFDTTIGRYPQDKEIAEVVAGQLAKVGVRVNVQGFEWAAFYDGVRAKKRAPIHDIGMSTELFDADNTMSLHFKSGTIWSRWDNPEFDHLVATARTTLSERARRTALWKASEIQHDEAPMIFLHQISYLYGVSKRVHGWEPTNTEPVLAWAAWVE